MKFNLSSFNDQDDPAMAIQSHLFESGTSMAAWRKDEVRYSREMDVRFVTL